MAEVHSFSQRRSSPRSADIAARHLTGYVTRTDTAALIVLAFAWYVASRQSRSNQQALIGS